MADTVQYVVIEFGVVAGNANYTVYIKISRYVDCKHTVIPLGHVSSRRKLVYSPHWYLLHSRQMGASVCFKTHTKTYCFVNKFTLSLKAGHCLYCVT